MDAELVTDVVRPNEAIDSQTRQVYVERITRTAMQKTPLIVLFAGLCLGLLFVSSILALDQPGKVPGKYLITDQHFPPIDKVINKSPQPFPVYGLYSWMGEYKRLRRETKAVGWKTFRIAGPLTDDDLKILYDDGINFTYLLPHPGKRDDFDSDEAYIEASVERARQFLDRYGKGGSFYKDFPKYRGRHIPFLQLRNEPNFHYMYKAGSEAEKQAVYAALAPRLAAVIRKKSPETKIIGFTTGGASAADIRFVKKVLAINPKVITEVDVFSTHPYVDPVPPETNHVKPWGSYSIANSLHALRKIFADHGRADIPVWYTEGGWQIGKKDGAAYDRPAHKIVPAELQAAYSCRYYALAVRLGVDCVTNMFITDTDGYPGGFFDRYNKNKWRPSAKAVQNMIRLMPHPALRGAQSDGRNGNYIYEFASNALEKNSRSVIMAYRIEGPSRVDIRVPYAKALITDMLGNSTEVAVANGKISYEIGPLPIYIRQQK